MQIERELRFLVERFASAPGQNGSDRICATFANFSSECNTVGVGQWRLQKAYASSFIVTDLQKKDQSTNKTDSATSGGFKELYDISLSFEKIVENFGEIVENFGKNVENLGNLAQFWGNFLLQNLSSCLYVQPFCSVVAMLPLSLGNASSIFPDHFCTKMNVSWTGSDDVRPRPH